MSTDSAKLASTTITRLANFHSGKDISGLIVSVNIPESGKDIVDIIVATNILETGRDISRTITLVPVLLFEKERKVNYSFN